MIKSSITHQMFSCTVNLYRDIEIKVLRWKGCLKCISRNVMSRSQHSWQRTSVHGILTGHRGKPWWSSLHNGTHNTVWNWLYLLKLNNSVRSEKIVAFIYKTLWQQLRTHLQSAAAHSDHKVDSSVVDEFTTIEELWSSPPQMDNREKTYSCGVQ